MACIFCPITLLIFSPKQNISVLSSRLRGRSDAPEQHQSSRGKTHKQGCVCDEIQPCFIGVLPHQKASTRVVTVFFPIWHLLCANFLCLNSALSCKQLDFSKTSAQAPRRLPNQGWFQTLQPDDWQYETQHLHSQSISGRWEIWSKRQSSRVSFITGCQLPPSPFAQIGNATNWQQNFPLQSSKKDHGGNTGAASTPGGYYEWERKAKRQFSNKSDVREQGSARG